MTVILAIDPGAVSGWALWHFGPITSGVAKTWKERADVISMALNTACEEPLVVAIEKWQPGGLRMSFSTMVGLGRARGKWDHVLEVAGIRRIVEATPYEWRKATIGAGRVGREDAKSMARARYPHAESPDGAEALCIAEWADKSGAAKAMAAKRFRRAA